MIKLYDLLLELNSIEEANKFQKAVTTGALTLAALTGGKHVIDKINQDKPEIQNINTPKNIDQSDFGKASIDIIDSIEGGYYSPGQVDDERYKKSGETMFGIDRKNFGNIKNNKNIEYEAFWELIDKNKRKNPSDWKWNYRGGKLQTKLKKLVTNIMKSRFEKYFNKYLSNEAKKITKSDYRLYFIFVYSTWNGSSFFKTFADLINKEIEDGNFNTDSLFKILIDSRREHDSSLIRQQADKIERLANR
jgi:hypothetical protein